QEEDGAYAGRHPASSDEAIAQLERLRGSGSGYLVIPEPDMWWLEHYADFGRHLTERYELLTAEGSSCAVFRLGLTPGDEEAGPRRSAKPSLALAGRDGDVRSRRLPRAPPLG